MKGFLSKVLVPLTRQERKSGRKCRGEWSQMTVEPLVLSLETLPPQGGGTFRFFLMGKGDTLSTTLSGTFLSFLVPGIEHKVLYT